MTTRTSWVARRRVLLGALAADAGRSLATRRLQATASAVGIASSITAVVFLLAVVTGLRRFALESLESAGGNVIVVSAAPEAPAPDAMRLPARLRAGDEEALLSATGYFDMGSAENVTQAAVSAGLSVVTLETRGVTSEGLRILQVVAGSGRLLSRSEHASGSRVAVLGADSAGRLFGSRSPLGQRIDIGSWPFIVVGVLAWVGDPESGMRSSLDETIFVPFTAAADAFHGDDIVSSLRFRLRTLGTEAEGAAAVRTTLDRVRRQRGETGGELRVTNTIERLRVLSRVVTALHITVVVVGIVGLLAGAIGIANVLLVSVTERSVEIGIRRAFGATRGAVFTGLLFESLAISISGGVVGVLVAYALGAMTTLVPQIPAAARPLVTARAGVLTVVVLVVVGVIAGIAPARRAAAVYPAQALRTD